MSIFNDILKFIGLSTEEDKDEYDAFEDEKELSEEEVEKLKQEEKEKREKEEEQRSQREQCIDMNPFYDSPLCQYDKFTKNWSYESSYKHMLEDGTELVITATADKMSLLNGKPFSMQIKLFAPGEEYHIRRIHFIMDDRLFHFIGGTYEESSGRLCINQVTKEFYNKLVTADYMAIQVECMKYKKLSATDEQEESEQGRTGNRKPAFLDKVLNGGYDFDEKNVEEEPLIPAPGSYGKCKFTIDPIMKEEFSDIIEMAKMIKASGVWEMASDYDEEPMDDYSEPLR